MQIQDLHLYKKNAKKHPEDQVKKIAESIKRFGFNVPILINKENEVITGHGRIEASKLLGIKEVRIGEARAKKGERFIPALKIEDLTPEEERLYRIADNKLNESPWDMPLVIEELTELNIKGEKIEITGFELKDLETFDPIDDFEDEPDFSKTGIKTCPKCGHEWKD